YMIADAGSTNGTFVNGQRIAFATPLRSGDQVRLGSDVALRFAILDPEEESALIQASEEDDRDPVTGLVGRNHLEHALDVRIRCAKRRGSPLSLLKMEIDQLEGINASQGPLVTDEIVAGVARTVRQGVGACNTLGCNEDGQFVLIAPATPLEHRFHERNDQVCAQVGHRHERARCDRI
ncbi:MAG: diguanylate cyclase, partial [Gemmatimonadales bacterium]|nr:diguanylate cyclase [Gemmatimonadales bacterium]